MAAEAETLLAGTGWLPEPLRTPGRIQAGVNDGGETGEAGADSAIVETAPDGGETAMADELASDDTGDARSRAIAAE